MNLLRPPRQAAQKDDCSCENDREVEARPGRQVPFCNIARRDKVRRQGPHEVQIVARHNVLRAEPQIGEQQADNSRSSEYTYVDPAKACFSLPQSKAGDRADQERECPGQRRRYTHRGPADGSRNVQRIGAHDERFTCAAARGTLDLRHQLLGQEGGLPCRCDGVGTDTESGVHERREDWPTIDVRRQQLAKR